MSRQRRTSKKEGKPRAKGRASLLNPVGIVKMLSKGAGEGRQRTPPILGGCSNQRKLLLEAECTWRKNQVGRCMALGKSHLGTLERPNVFLNIKKMSI